MEFCGTVEIKTGNEGLIMKAKEFIIELKKDLKPGNPIAVAHQKHGGSKSGAHKDKTKVIPRNEKHKKSSMPMETALRDKEDLQAKRKALQDLSMNKDVDQKTVQQRKLDLEKEAKTKGMAEEAPKGWEGTVKAMKKHKDIDNPYALAWSMKNKGYKSHKKEDTTMERDRDPEDWDEGNTEPPNNFAVYINGKKWKVFKGRGQFADDYKERDHFRQLQSWAQQKSAATGKKWEVYVTGESPTA